MPPLSPAPFLYVKKKEKSFFSLSTEPTYSWDTQAIGVEKDTGLRIYKYVLENWLRKKAYFKGANEAPDLPRRITSENKTYYSLCQGIHKHKIFLEDFDDLNIEYWPDLHFAFNLANVHIKYNINKGESVGINFRDIFLVIEGEAPPAHYRPGIDLLVSSVEQYHQAKNRFSYQLGKYLLNEFKYTPSPANSCAFSWNDYKTPLKDYYYFNSALECYLSYCQHDDKLSNQNVMAFTSPISVRDLLPLFQYLAQKKLQELTLVLKEPLYEDEQKRKRVYEKLVALIADSKCNFMVHIILVTKDNLNCNLLDLKPNSQENIDGFHPLAHNAGYYFSSTKAISLIYRAIQAKESVNNSWLSNLQQRTPRRTLPGTYIIAQATSQTVRNSKTLTREQLKSKVQLSIAHQQSIANQEELSQTQAVNQQVQEQLAQNVNQAQNLSFEPEISWDFKTNLDSFCNKLEAYAKKRLPEITEQESVLKQAGYLTQYYLNKHSKLHFYQQLASNATFRLEFAARFFGIALIEEKNEQGKLLKVKLSHYTIDAMEEPFANELIMELEHIKDGLPAKECIIKDSYFYGRTLCGLNRKLQQTVAYYAPPKIFSQLSYQSQLHAESNASNVASGGYQKPLNYSVLLPDELFSTVEVDLQQKLIVIAEQLLSLFKPHAPLNAKEIHALETQFLNLVCFYFPDHRVDIARLEQFIFHFADHNEDHLKILVQILISKHKNGLESLFQLLSFLEDRSLLDYFYKIHFQYALTVSSVNLILKSYASNIFLIIASRIPIGTKSNEWPDFELFTLHFLIFAAQNNLAMAHDELTKLEHFWKRIHAKFLLYSGNQEAEAQKLIHQLTQQLIHSNGLSIAPLSETNTFYVGLEELLDHAIERNTLKEQIDEIKGVSLLATDAPYAWEWNGFNVLSTEMQIHSTAINPLTKSYAVSNKELEHEMMEHETGSPSLKTMLFRFLGVQTLREDLAFYRQLHQTTTQTQDVITNYIAELLCAYHALTYTGNKYGNTIVPETFKENFKRFLSTHRLNKDLSDVQLSTEIEHFLVHISQLPTDEHNGVQNLWSIWRTQQVDAFKISKNPIPSVFLRKFATKKLGNFLFAQKENLEKALPELNNNPSIVNALINQWTDEFNISAAHKKIILAYLNKLYPGFDVKTVLRNLLQINGFFESLSTISRNNPQSFIYLTLESLIERNTNVGAFLCFIELFARELSKHQGHATTDKKASRFLLTLAKKPHIYYGLPQTKNLISTLIESSFKIENQEDPRFLLDLVEKLLHLGNDKTERAFTVLSQMAKNNDGLAFLNTHSYLDALQLKEIALFLSKVNSYSYAIDLMEGLFEHDNAYDLGELNAALSEKSSEEAQVLLKLAQSICQQTERPLLEELRKLQDKPLSGLKKLTQLHQVQFISAPEILTLLDSPALDETITRLKRQKFQENLHRFEYDPQFVKEKIASIKLKSHTHDEDLPLNQAEQDSLWTDYQLLMSYMTKKSFKFESLGIIKECCIQDLEEQDFPILFKTLQDRIKKGEDLHHNQLLLIALSAEALYQTTKKFPRCTQILTLLKRLHYPGNLIHELKTGEGKSIVGAMHGAWLCAQGHAVDIATENDELARNALEKFGPFYWYLGITLGKDILAAQSAHHEYIANGINYSTASNLALFRTRMALEKKSLPTNSALICDEIDAILTMTIQFRLAATLNPLLNNTKQWSKVYQLILEFVKENELYINNPCSPEEDVLNLKNYFIIKNPDQDFLKFTNKISNELFNTLIESSMVAHELEEKIDYYVVEAKGTTEKQYYAAPIIASTKRPDPKVSYSLYVQQLLHTLLNNKKPPPPYPFVIEPSTETLVATSAKNFFDYYRLNDSPIVGLTGTSGTRVELVEFNEEQGLVAFQYPTFHPDLAENLGLVTAFGTEEHLEKIHEWIEMYKRENPSQPILLITPSPQATENIWDFLKAKTRWQLQCFHGYAEAGKSEENVIYTAGKDDLLTIANQSLGRGADIAPEHEQGLLVINTCTDLTPSELEQIQGRAARDGKPGGFISLIDAQNIGSPTDSAETLTDAFKAHQLQISLKQQQERSKMRLLEDARYFMTHEYILKLRETADKILMRQYGKGASITEHQNLLRTLNILNQNAEKHYEHLLKTHKTLDDNDTREFLAARINDQNLVLNQWIPQDKYNSVQFVEPSIPLDVFTGATLQLQGIEINQLSALAYIFSCKWSMDGHQKAMQNIQTGEEVIELFDPYIKKNASLKQTIGQALERKEYIQPQLINDLVRDIKSAIDDLITYAQTIPLIGYLVPAERIKLFISDYLDTTKKQIEEKKWDEITLPQINFSSVNTWFSGIGTALTISAVLVGGPIPYIIKNFIIPTIFDWMKNKLKSQFADSESLVAQILIGLDEIGNDLSKIIKAYTELANETEIKVGWFTDNFGPLVKNQALLWALSKYLEMSEKKDLIPLVPLMPEILTLLEAYREQQPNALLSVNTLMTFLCHASQSEPILNALEKTPYKEGLLQITQLNPNFINKMSDLSFSGFLNLLKVIAHPNFFSLLEKLPATTQYEQLCQWLETIPEDLPLDYQHALKEFLDYQKDPVRVAEESKQDLLKLHTKFNLTMERFTAGLERLKPKPLIKVEPSLLQAEIPEKSFWDTQQILICSVALVILACSIIYLSISLALTGVFLMGWMAYPYLEQQISSSLNPVQKVETKEAPSEPSPLALLNRSPANTPNSSEEKNAVPKVPERLLKIKNSKDVFFAQASISEYTFVKNRNVEPSCITAVL